jgi:hypothetical protein
MKMRESFALEGVGRSFEGVEADIEFGLRIEALKHFQMLENIGRKSLKAMKCWKTFLKHSRKQQHS